MLSNNYIIYLTEKAYNEAGVMIHKADPDQLKAPSEEYVVKGKEIAEISGLLYGGWWDDLNAWFFNDELTGSTIIARNVEEAIKKKKELHQKHFASKREKELTEV